MDEDSDDEDSDDDDDEEEEEEEKKEKGKKRKGGGKHRVGDTVWTKHGRHKWFRCEVQRVADGPLLLRRKKRAPLQVRAGDLLLRFVGWSAEHDVWKPPAAVQPAGFEPPNVGEVPAAAKRAQTLLRKSKAQPKPQAKKQQGRRARSKPPAKGKTVPRGSSGRGGRSRASVNKFALS